MNWSGGKDAALALKTLLEIEKYEVVALLTTFNDSNKLSSAHSLPVSLLEKQADAIGIPLFPVFITKEQDNYKTIMLETVSHFKSLGVNHFAFGDLYLDEVKEYREEMLIPHEITPVFPLFGTNPEELMSSFLQSGIKAKIVTTQADKLDASYIGMDITKEFIDFLPDGIDICGENGEYHSFVYDGPFFKYPIAFSIEETIKLSFDIGLDTGEVKTFEYWQAKFS